MNDDPKFDQWCLVEVMGHHRYAGRVTEQQIGGASFIRVDVPETKETPAFTKLLSPGAIFALTPVVEQTARVAAQGFRSRPYSMFEMAMLPSPSREDEDEESDLFES